eukprot:m.118425 g.118425  ORF g.118425 m.118425 type:complete len:172 (+) comp12893_c4_seq1:180-695(+)
MFWFSRRMCIIRSIQLLMLIKELLLLLQQSVSGANKNFSSVLSVTANLCELLYFHVREGLSRNIEGLERAGKVREAILVEPIHNFICCPQRQLWGGCHIQTQTQTLTATIIEKGTPVAVHQLLVVCCMLLLLLLICSVLLYSTETLSQRRGNSFRVLSFFSINSIQDYKTD